MSLFGTSPFDHLLPDGWMAVYFGILASLPVLLLVFLALRRKGKRRFFHTLVPVEPVAIPRDLARFGQPWLGRLAYLGFPMVRALRTPDGIEAESVSWLLSNAKDRATGVLTGALPARGGKPVFSLRLVTFLSDGRVIVTADRVITRRPPAHWCLSQRGFSTLESQVREHREQVAGRANGAVAQLPQPLELPARLGAEARAEFDAWQASGDYVACGPDALRPAWSRLPRLACRDFAALFTGSAFPPGRKKDVASAASAATPGEEEIAPVGAALSLSPEQLVERDILRYRKHADQAPGGKHLLFRLFLLVATLVFFTATFGRENPAATVAMLLGLIALHEFGHWLAMKVSGYHGMGRFFVPFVGPVDRGRKLHATPWQQLFVILAGPVPGLLAGMAILVAGYFLPNLPLWLLDLGGLAVVLNAFHLLPFLPLDGGKIVDLLVFRDLPMLRPLFTAISAISTLLASFLLRSRAIRVIAIGMFAGLIWDLKMIKVVRGGRRLGWAGAIDDEEDALRRIFRGVREEENEAFLRSHDWQRQIDVLLAEVLRKRPGFLTRLLGGALYGFACLPVFALIAALAVAVFSGLGNIGLADADSREFREAFPYDRGPILEARLAPLDELIATTWGSIGEELPRVAPATEERVKLAAKAAPQLGTALDQLDWTTVGIALHEDHIAPQALSIWLEILCQKLEQSTRAGRHAETTVRAEVLLHGIGAMEPAPTLAHRELLWDAELRTLQAVEELSASGGIAPATRQRIESRVSALNKSPLPEVESLLLVSGWVDAQVAAMLGQTGRQGDAAPLLEDPRVWRFAYPHLRRFAENGISFRRGTPATVALARHWSKTRRAGEIPPKLEEPAAAAPGEADFIVAFCESHRRIQWRRMTTLSALKMEDYRLKTGSFPNLWKHSVPGGATLELAQEGGPVIELTDRRAAIQQAVPGWLGATGKAPPPIDHKCKLFGAR